MAAAQSGRLRCELLFLLRATVIVLIAELILQRDEDFDDSFESLMNLTASLGEVKPRHTPDHVIGGLPSALYKDWATPGCDQRCPICLDDVRCSPLGLI